MLLLQVSRTQQRTKSGDMAVRDAKIVDAAHKWLSECGLSAECSLFLTLTFKPLRFGRGPSQRTAEKHITHFLRRVQRKTSGNAQDRHKRRLKVISVREGSPTNDPRVHYHLILEVPSTHTRSMFLDICAAAWSAMCHAGHADLQLCRDEGALFYMLKPRTKPDFADSLDVVNTHL